MAMNAHPRRLIVVVVLLAVTLGMTSASWGQDLAPADRALLNDLIALDPIHLDWMDGAGDWNLRLPAGQRIGEDGIPEDGAALDIQLAFWTHPVHSLQLELEGREPSPVVMKRLQEVCFADPEGWPDLRTWLARTVEGQARLREVLGASLILPPPDEWWDSPEQTARVIRQARAARDRNAKIDGEMFLTALAERRPGDAEPVLLEHVAGNSPRTRALSLSLLHAAAIRHELPQEAARWREQLKAVATDPEQPGLARRIAWLAVMRETWSGQEEWLRSLFHQPELRDFRDVSSHASGFGKPVLEDPDRWIPVVTELIGHEDREVHNAAVECLLQFDDRDEVRVDALRPLLPWLSSRGWARSTRPDARDDVVYRLSLVELPEAVPHLIVYLEQAKDRWSMRRAAEALEHYRDPRAIPVLRSAQKRGQGAERELAKALIACGGFDDEELVAAVVAWNRHDPDGNKAGNPDRRLELLDGSGLSPILLLGNVLSDPRNATDSLADHLVEWCEEHSADETPVVASIRTMLAAWKTPAAIRHSVSQLAAGRLEARAIMSLLINREVVMRHAGVEIDGLLGADRLEAGVAAIISGSPRTISAILTGDSPLAQAGLLASARLIRERLPLAEVKPLLETGNTARAVLAENYLIVDDRLEARRLVWARHPGEALILGGPPGLRLRGSYERMREFILGPIGPDEIIALHSDWRGSTYIHITDGEGTLFGYAHHEKVERKLTREELADLRTWLAENEINRLPPLCPGIFDGVQYEFLHLTRDGGYRIYMNNPGASPPWDIAWDRLVQRFEDLVGK